MVLCHTTHLAAVLALSMSPPPGWPQFPGVLLSVEGVRPLQACCYGGFRTSCGYGCGFCAGVENVQYVSRALMSPLSVWQAVWPELKHPTDALPPCWDHFPAIHAPCPPLHSFLPVIPS